MRLSVNVVADSVGYGNKPEPAYIAIDCRIERGPNELDELRLLIDTVENLKNTLMPKASAS